MDLAEKDATEKSDTARELALDIRKGSGGGSDNSKHAHEKTKDKKKNMEHRKTKDSKATGNNELILHHETTKAVSSPVSSNGDHPDSEIVVSVHGDASEHEEEEIRRKIELEAEERKLEETLEYQRRIEDEAKQKYLAEQHKKANRTIPEKHSDDESLLAGLPNDIPEDDILSNKRRTERKSILQKSSAKLLQTNYQTLSYEKENIEVGQVRVPDFRMVTAV